MISYSLIEKSYVLHVLIGGVSPHFCRIAVWPRILTQMLHTLAQLIHYTHTHTVIGATADTVNNKQYTSNTFAASLSFSLLFAVCKCGYLDRNRTNRIKCIFGCSTLFVFVHFFLLHSPYENLFCNFCHTNETI